MNNSSRKTLKINVKRLPEKFQECFKLMYGRDNGKRSVEDTKRLSVEETVDCIPDRKIDWATKQVENSFKLFKVKLFLLLGKNETI